MTEPQTRKVGTRFYRVDVFGPDHLDTVPKPPGGWWFTRILEMWQDYTTTLHQTRHVDGEGKARADGEAWLDRFLETGEGLA